MASQSCCRVEMLNTTDPVLKATIKTMVVSDGEQFQLPGTLLRNESILLLAKVNALAITIPQKITLKYILF